jgi:hypothetical protein
LIHHTRVCAVWVEYETRVFKSSWVWVEFETRVYKSSWVWCKSQTRVIFIKLGTGRVFGLYPNPHPEPGKYRVRMYESGYKVFYLFLFSICNNFGCDKRISLQLKNRKFIKKKKLYYATPRKSLRNNPNLNLKNSPIWTKKIVSIFFRTSDRNNFWFLEST